MYKQVKRLLVGLDVFDGYRNVLSCTVDGILTNTFALPPDVHGVDRVAVRREFFADGLRVLQKPVAVR